MALPDRAIIANLGAVAITALAGAWITDIGPWYRGLRKPSWQPPDWAFGPAWTTIFLCAAWAGVLAWRSPDFASRRTLVLVAYGTNYALNMLWSALFFRMRRPDWALIEILPFVGSILLMMYAVAPLSRPAVLLLVPYLCWVSFATVLNVAIIQRNRPF